MAIHLHSRIENYTIVLYNLRMEYEMLKALENNPHYIMSEEQRIRWNELNREPTVFAQGFNSTDIKVLFNNSKTKKEYGRKTQ